MIITDRMDLNELAERMGSEATLAEAAHMAAALEGLGRYVRTEEVPADEWSQLLEAAGRQAQLDD